LKAYERFEALDCSGKSAQNKALCHSELTAVVTFVFYGRPSHLRCSADLFEQLGGLNRKPVKASIHFGALAFPNLIGTSVNKPTETTELS